MKLEELFNREKEYAALDELQRIMYEIALKSGWNQQYVQWSAPVATQPIERTVWTINTRTQEGPLRE